MDFTTLIKELGIDKFPESEQKMIFEQMFKALQTRVTLRLSQELTAEQTKSLEAASAKGEEAAMAELERIYPNYQKMYQEEIDSLKEDMK